jgi:hypothetical protein
MRGHLPEYIKRPDAHRVTILLFWLRDITSRIRLSHSNALKINRKLSTNQLDFPAYLWSIRTLKDQKLVQNSVALNFPPGFGHVTHGAELYLQMPRAVFSVTL